MAMIACVDDEDDFFVLQVSRGPRVTYSRMTLLKDENMCIIVLPRFFELAGRFCEAFFPI